MTSGAPPAPPDLRALARRELAIPGRYRLGNSPAAPGDADPIWLRALRWLFDRWHDLWRGLASHVHVGDRAATGIGDGVLALVAAALMLALFFVARNVYVARAASRLAAEPIGGPPDPLSLYRRACDAAGRADYGGAVVLLFGATVATLGARGAIAGGPDASVGDIRRELRAAHPSVMPQFDAVAAPFVERAYAERTVAAPQWQQARTAFTTIWEVVEA